MKDTRLSLLINLKELCLNLWHDKGLEQVDFSEMSMLVRHYHIFVRMFSNRHRSCRLAQNFECLAYGVAQMFSVIGRVPRLLRCSHISTAVAKVICPKMLARVSATTTAQSLA